MVRFVGGELDAYVVQVLGYTVSKLPSNFPGIVIEEYGINLGNEAVAIVSNLRIVSLQKCSTSSLSILPSRFRFYLGYET